MPLQVNFELFSCNPMSFGDYLQFLPGVMVFYQAQFQPIAIPDSAILKIWMSQMLYRADTFDDDTLSSICQFFTGSVFHLSLDCRR